VARDAPHLVCSDVRVRNLARSVRFYRSLGLSVAARTQMDDATKIVWMVDRATGQLLELFELSRRSPLYRPFRRYSGTEHALLFGVRDAGRTSERLRRQGARLIQSFREGDVDLVFLRDPDGTWIELLGWTGESRPRHAGFPLATLHRSGRRSPRRRAS
jgi:catechol 2,3-dioxygenase-like lactoylglutathione lyase family enzyme